MERIDTNSYEWHKRGTVKTVEEQTIRNIQTGGIGAVMAGVVNGWETNHAQQNAELTADTGSPYSEVLSARGAIGQVLVDAHNTILAIIRGQIKPGEVMEDGETG
jgi:hypothetical protein